MELLKRQTGTCLWFDGMQWKFIYVDFADPFKIRNLTMMGGSLCVNGSRTKIQFATNIIGCCTDKARFEIQIFKINTTLYQQFKQL